MGESPKAHTSHLGHIPKPPPAAAYRVTRVARSTSVAVQNQTRPADTTLYATMLAQHRIIDELLVQLRQMIQPLEERADRAPSRRVLLRLQKTLLAHIELEDTILFREFEAQSGLREEGPTATLRREHDVLKARVTELLAAWKSSSIALLLRQLAAFDALYTDHCRREDVMYGICERLLSPELHAEAQRRLTPTSKTPKLR